MHNLDETENFDAMNYDGGNTPLPGDSVRDLTPREWWNALPGKRRLALKALGVFLLLWAWAIFFLQL